MGLFKRRDGLQQEQKQDPVQQAKEALTKHLEYLRTIDGMDDNVKNRAVGKERTLYRDSADTPEQAIDMQIVDLEDALAALEKGEIRKAVQYLSGRNFDSITSLDTEDYFTEARRVLSDYMEAGILDGRFDVDDMSFEPVDHPNSIVAYKDLKVPAGTKLPDGRILEEEAELKLLVNGRFAFVNPSGEIFIIKHDHYYEFLNLINAINKFDRGVDILKGRESSFTIPKGTELPGNRVLEDNADIYMLGSTVGGPWAIKEGSKEPELLGLVFSEKDGWKQLWEKYHKV